MAGVLGRCLHAANSIILAAKPAASVISRDPLSCLHRRSSRICRPVLVWIDANLRRRAGKARHGREDSHAIRHRHSDRRRFMAGRQTCRGAGLCPRLVLRHADAERRPVCRDGRSGTQDDQDPARHRRADPVEPDCTGRGECFRLAEQIGAGTDRFRGRDRLHRKTGDGAWARSSSPTWRNTSASSWRCCAGRRSRPKSNGRSG